MMSNISDNNPNKPYIYSVSEQSPAEKKTIIKEYAPQEAKTKPDQISKDGDTLELSSKSQ